MGPVQGFKPETAILEAVRWLIGRHELKVPRPPAS